jgi:hypothetical protein
MANPQVVAFYIARIQQNLNEVQQMLTSLTQTLNGERMVIDLTSNHMGMLYPSPTPILVHDPILLEPNITLAIIEDEEEDEDDETLGSEDTWSSRDTAEQEYDLNDPFIDDSEL